MVALLPLELLQAISHQYPCRDSQIRQLTTYYNVRPLRPDLSLTRP
jgi:hypothetical protein